MKKLLLALFIVLITTFSHAQNGLENIIVEKYYVSNAADASGSVGILPLGSVTYRIYVDMLPGYQVQSIYGSPQHNLFIKTTTTFFNNEDYGASTPTISKKNVAKNTAMLDSWLSVGAACSGNFGVLKTEDDGVLNVVNADGILANTDASMGIPLTTQDGLMAGAPQSVTFVGINSSDLGIFDGTSQVGNNFTVTNGAWASLSGSTGPTANNRVLIAQLTTDGELSFELNIQLRTPLDEAETYVAKDPTGSEIKLSGLTYPIVAVTGVKISPTSANIAVGNTKQLTDTVYPLNATNKIVSWSSNKPLIATVSNTGLVSAVAPGTAIITVTTDDGSKTASSNITVTQPVSGVSVDPTSTNIFVGNMQQLTATVSPVDASNKKVTWSTDKPLVATVNSTGQVTGVSAGTATITATTEDGSKKATSFVTVSFLESVL